LSEQIQTSRLRKGFLVVGIVLLILSFFFFYLASTIDYDYESGKPYNIDSAHWYNITETYNFGKVYEYYVNHAMMQQNDVIIVSFDYAGGHVVLKDSDLNIITQSRDSVFFTNYEPYSRLVEIYVTFPYDNANLTDILNFQQEHGPIIYVTYDHYGRPQWVYFGIGVVLASLAVIPVLKSKK
jgi:hypothetical protein